MSALRRAGVWLGLVEDEDDLYDDEPDLGDRDRRDRGRGDRGRSRAGGRWRERHLSDGDDDLTVEAIDGEDFGDADGLSRPRGGRGADRAHGAGPTRGAEPPGRRRDTDTSVRSITRDSSVSYLTRDNAALAPQVDLPIAAPEPERRYQITTLHPTTYREARTIGEHFRDGTPVIMNLTEMDEADARRLVDFGAGLAFGLRGTMERVTNRVFLLSPANVQVTPEDKARIADGGFFRRS
jgi:cell division inhibitor SepF